MDTSEFREFAKAAVDYIADYVDSIRSRPVLPSVQPGYLATLVPQEMPQQGEDWRAILRDMDTVIMPGMTHWQSPQFHAYFPTASSLPSIVGDMLSSALGVIGFSWLSSPACTELEVLVMNWLGKALGLPEEFLNCSEGPGGGVIQGSASEATLVAVLAAKRKTILRLLSADPSLDETQIKNRLVAYTSDQANSSVEKSANIGDVRVRLLASDAAGMLRGDTFRAAVVKDIAEGNIPCCLIATMGTTGTCAFDDLEELGPLCARYNIWLHIDAAYAGAALLLPEYAHLKRGLQYADSFDFNPHKWLLVNFDCSAMWVKDANHLLNAFFVDRVYLRHTDAPMNTQAPDYMHWQIPLGRRFRALKLWMTLRVYGVQGLQEHLRKQVSLAKMFADLVQADVKFELVVPPSMGLACFRLKGDNELNKQLYESLTARKVIYLVKASFHGRLVLRFAICSRLTEAADVTLAWREIQNATQLVWSQTSFVMNHPNLKNISDINSTLTNFISNTNSTLTNFISDTNSTLTNFISDIKPTLTNPKSVVKPKLDSDFTSKFYPTSGNSTTKKDSNSDSNDNIVDKIDVNADIKEELKKEIESVQKMTVVKPVAVGCQKMPKTLIPPGGNFH